MAPSWQAGNLASPPQRSILRMSANRPPLSPLSTLIFASRWLQLPLYLGLIVAQCVYVFLFGKELWHLISHSASMGEQQIMLIVLGLIDVVMISNLLVMVIVGGYETFVSRLRLEGHPDQPEWLSHVNASVLKVKLAMAIIGISSIHLLKTFIASGALGGIPLCTPEQMSVAAANIGVARCSMLTQDGVLWQTIIHCVFILSAIGIAWTDKLMSNSHSKSHDH
ncbi:TIGR00645 family protein [Stenotrophomonas geniculata]